MLINKSSISKMFLLEILDCIHSSSATSERQTLHIATFSTSQGDDVLLGQHVQRWWVDTLLIDDHETLIGAVAELLLQFNNFCNSLVDEIALCSYQLFTLFCCFVEESTVYLKNISRMKKTFVCLKVAMILRQELKFVFVKISPIRDSTLELPENLLF